MIRAREDRWFDRFRRTGDPRPLAKVFEQTAPELWKVAIYLCRDRHAAEDAVQGAFLAAIEAQGDWDAARPLLPWLLGLLANRVREHRRREARVPDVARVVAAAGERDPAELAELGEFGSAFRTALARVAEPFRTALERHLVHGHAAHEIAAEIGVPPGTVRMRLHRGLDQLRQKLPPGFVAGGVAVAALSPESFAAMRQVVLARVPGGAAVAAVGSGHFVLVGVLGGILMKKVMAAVAAGLVLVIGLWSLWPDASARPPEVPTGSSVAATTTNGGSEEQGLVTGASDPTVAERRDAAPAVAATGTLRIVLRNAGNQHRIAGAEVQVLREVRVLAPRASGSATAAVPVPAATSASAVQNGKSDAEGTATFVVAAGAVQVTVVDLLDAPVEVDVPADRVTERIVDVPVRIAADVLVVDAAGRPVADALLLGRRNAYLGGQHAEIGRTGVDGRWREACIERQLLVRAVVDGLGASPAVLLNDKKQTTTLRLGGAAATLHGTVLDREGQPVAMAWMAIKSQVDPNDPPLVLRADAHGGYRCAYVPPGPCRVYAWREAEPGENRFAMASAVAAAGVETLALVRFGRGAQVRAIVRQPGGAPWRGVFVTALPVERLGLGIDTYRRVATDARGEATLDGLLPGAYELQVQVENQDCRELVELAEGQDYPFVRELGGSSWVEVHAVDAEQRPLAGWTAKLQVDAGQMPWLDPIGNATVDARGLVRFERLPSRPFVVSLHQTPTSLASVSCEALPNRRTEIVVTRAQMPEARLSGSIALAPGMPSSELRVGVVRKEIGGRPNKDPRDGLEVHVDPTGRFAIAGLPAGTYHLGIRRHSSDPNSAGRVVAVRLGIEVAGGADVDIGLVEVGAATLRVRIARADGVPVVEPRLLLGRGWVEQATTCGVVVAADVVEARELPPSTYSAMVWGENVGLVSMPITLRANEVVEVPVVAPAAVPTTFRFVGLPAGTSFGRVSLSLAGVALATEMVREPGARYVRGLVPGSYRVEFETVMVPDPVRGAADFTVGSSPGPVVEVRVGK